MAKQLTVAIAGSTERSALCLSALLADERIRVMWALTPSAKLIGRKQILTENPLATLATERSLPVISVTQKLDSEVRDAIAEQVQPDVLLVVDFGYMVPNWLLELPAIAPVNIHPSTLPRWRGSSPGQFALLYGDTESAVSLIVMNDLMDQGEIITQLPFLVNQTWTTAEYYRHSFALVSATLPQLLLDFAGGKLPAQAQPLASPTPVASRLSKADSFVPWELVQKAVQAGGQIAFVPNQGLSAVLDDAWKASDDLQLTLERAVRAFSPWPRLWTRIPTSEGEKRLQFLTAAYEDEHFKPIKVVVEGKNIQTWNSTKQIFSTV